MSTRFALATCLGLALVATDASAQDTDELGLGLVLLRTWPPIGDTRAFDFVESVVPEDTFGVFAPGISPARSILFYSVPGYRFIAPGVDRRPESGLISDNGRIAFIDDPSWFNALFVTPHYDVVGLRWIDQEGNWVRVVVNEDDRTALWTRLGPNTMAIEWEEAFSQSDCTERDFSWNGRDIVYTQPLRTEPSDQAPVLDEPGGGDCFEVLSVEGSWLRVQDGYGQKEGIWWIRWRKDQDLLAYPGRRGGIGQSFD